jgi:hypothetical protein
MITWLIVQILFQQRLAHAENFSSTAFQQQWNATDQAVTSGQVSRTYFWGPAPFAHTNEVYAEASNLGQRQVQYFDKARMELTKKPEQDPNYVTNGLLTVELVRGQLQVGDNAFLNRLPATNPVAGDPVGNDNAPTYASYNQGKLAFGVSGATPTPDRSGQVMKEGLNKAGVVSVLDQPPVSLKYAHYFAETGHNVADVFYNFFQQEPLGESKWLEVMGLPISEPMWAKDKVVVAGQPREVLIQLFERRVLTYTPSNPDKFQIEMGNIGQHYYIWRYGFDLHEGLPGQYRMVTSQGKSVISTSLNSSQSFKYGETPSNITSIWTMVESRAVVATPNNLYLVDLTKQRSFQSLKTPEGLSNFEVTSVHASADGRKVAVLFNQTNGADSKAAIQVYELGTLETNNLAVNNTFTAYNGGGGITELRVSPDGDYLVFYGVSQDIPSDGYLSILQLSNGTSKRLKVADLATGVDVRLSWAGSTNRLLVSVASRPVRSDIPRHLPGNVWLVDVPRGNSQLLLQSPGVYEALTSPDGNYFALIMDQQPFQFSGIPYGSITFRKLSDPEHALAPAYQQGTSGRYSFLPTLQGWNADGTAVLVNSVGTGPNKSTTDYSLVSLVSGQPIWQKSFYSTAYDVASRVKLGGPFYLLLGQNQPNTPTPESDSQTINVTNLDGSDSYTLFTGQNNLTSLLTSQIAQVPWFKGS